MESSLKIHSVNTVIKPDHKETTVIITDESGVIATAILHQRSQFNMEKKFENLMRLLIKNFDNKK